MKSGFIAFILGIAVGAAGYWFFTARENQDEIARAKDEIVEGAGKVKESIQNTVKEINTDDIKEELSRTGAVIREKTKNAGQAIADVTADARITAAIKTKLATEPNVSALKINVDTTDGLVTLSGTSKSYDEVAKAVKLALDTEGVRKVVSTIQVTSAK